MNTISLPLKDLTTAHVMSVYTGRDGACCCGCAGTHRYNSTMVEAAGKDRGYPVTQEEVNDKQVLRVLRQVQAEGERVENSGLHLYVAVGSRALIVYLAPGVQVEVA